MVAHLKIRIFDQVRATSIALRWIQSSGVLMGGILFPNFKVVNKNFGTVEVDTHTHPMNDHICYGRCTE